MGDPIDGVADSVDTSAASPATHEKRRRAGELCLALAADEVIVKGRAQWRGPGMQAHRDVSHASPVEGMGAATSA